MQYSSLGKRISNQVWIPLHHPSTKWHHKGPIQRVCSALLHSRKKVWSFYDIEQQDRNKIKCGEQTRTDEEANVSPHAENAYQRDSLAGRALVNHQCLSLTHVGFQNN